MSETKQVTVIDGSATNVWATLRELGAYRELIGRLAFRGIKLRYTQSILGPLWVLVEPILSMIVFTLVFSGILNVDTGDIPYPLFNFSGLVIWTFFVNALANVTLSLTANMNLVTKIYVPRLILPIVGTITPLLDLVVALVVLFVLMLLYGAPLYATVLLLPIFVIVTIGFVLAVGLILAIINTRYRDIGYALPMLMRVLVFTAPINYPIDRVPEQWRWVYELNPMAHVVQGFRWCLLQDKPVNLPAFGISVLLMLIVLIFSIFYFQRNQRTIVDRL
jgi:lipopolysaccharide transport system permease protein